MHGNAGLIKFEQGRFHYCDEDGNWRKVNIWVEGTTINLSPIDHGDLIYSVEGDLVGLASLPVEQKGDKCG